MNFDRFLVTKLLYDDFTTKEKMSAFECVLSHRATVPRATDPTSHCSQILMSTGRWTRNCSQIQKIIKASKP